MEGRRQLKNYAAADPSLKGAPTIHPKDNPNAAAAPRYSHQQPEQPPLLWRFKLITFPSLIPVSYTHLTLPTSDLV